jgi:tetratricopeptide (TPR) repeat protein
MSRTFTRAVLALALLAGSSMARAASESEASFRAHYDNALNLYSAEQYDDAIKEFQAAYVIRPRPRLLFNIGQAHRNLGNYKEALRFYLMYQAMEPNPKPGLRAELERYIAQMKQLIGTAVEVAQVENPDRKPEAAGADDKARSERPSEAKLAPPSPSEPAAGPTLVASQPPARKPLHRRGWFWGVVGGAAASVLVIGLAAGLTAGHSDVVRWSGN